MKILTEKGCIELEGELYELLDINQTIGQHPQLKLLTVKHTDGKLIIKGKITLLAYLMYLIDNKKPTS